MDEKLRLTYLYDFYGELLNGHQRQVFEDAVFHDLSLSEIAQEEAISRQGVSDLIRRCTRKLEDYETKLHLVGKFLSVKEDVAQIHKLSRSFFETGDEALIGRIEALSNHILEEL